MEQEKMILAHLSDFSQIDALFEECKASLLNQRIFQWDETYPNSDYLREVIIEKEMFALKIGDSVMGALVLNEWQSPEWNAINWNHPDEAALVLHSFCVHPSVQNHGFGKKMLQFAEAFAKEKGYVTIRLDAYSGNESALRFYEKSGYTKTGEVFFSSKPAGHAVYYCFEKKL